LAWPTLALMRVLRIRALMGRGRQGLALPVLRLLLCEPMLYARNKSLPERGGSPRKEWRRSGVSFSLEEVVESSGSISVAANLISCSSFSAHLRNLILPRWRLRERIMQLFRYSAVR
jgi:hypothetical protein